MSEEYSQNSSTNKLVGQHHSGKEFSEITQIESPEDQFIAELKAQQFIEQKREGTTKPAAKSDIILGS